MAKKRLLTKTTDLSHDDLFKILKEQLQPGQIIDYDEIPTSSLFKPHFETLTKLILHTVTTGESNSLFIVGPRGSGKSTLLKSGIDVVLKNKIAKNEIMIVELHGFIHTDDNIALKDIARQLKLNNVLEEKVTGTFADNMALILETLKNGSSNDQTLIICLEEFDLFSHHKNQTLLYNLFDVAQNTNTPIVVIGVTCRLDVIELLEKRVKSRFSHRQLYVFAKITLEDYIATAQYWLTVRNNIPDSPLKLKWNNFVSNSLLKSNDMHSMLKLSYNLSPNFFSLKRVLWPILGQLSLSLKTLQWTDLSLLDNIAKHSFEDAKQAIVQSLSLLELTLVIVMSRHSSIHEGEPFNFNIIYEEYKKLIRNDSGAGLSGMQEFSKPVVSKAFENLLNLELIRPEDNFSILSSYKGQKDYRSMNLLLQAVQFKEALKNYPSLPTQLNQIVSNLI